MGYLAIAVAAYVGFIAVLYVAQRHLLYHPDQYVPAPGDFGVPEMSAIRIPTEDGFELLAWWRPAQDVDRPVLAYFHGNAGHLGDRADKVRAYLAAGYGVLLVTYRYNASSGGTPSEAALLRDGEAALSFLKRQAIETRRIVPYGESLGTGIAVAVAAKHDVGAVILEAPYSAMTDLAQHHYWYVPARWLVRDRFESIARIEKIQAPLLVVHGMADSLIPPQFGRRLFDAAPEPKESHFIERAQHNDLLDFGLAEIGLQFLQKYLVDAPVKKP